MPLAPSAPRPGATTTASPGPAAAAAAGPAASGLVHEFFEAQAAARPDRIAVEFDGTRLTYGELEARANQLARLLRASGLAPGGYVAMHLPRSPEVYVTLLAILKAGAAYVPVDPDCPPERVAGIVTDCQAPLLITTTCLAANLLALGCPVLCLDAQREALAAQATHRLPRAEVEVTSRDLCYVIYTSGSTGRPKGVQIEHRSAVNLVRAEGDIFKITPADRVYQGFSVAFDASVEEIWLAFFAGATLVAATDDMHRAGPELSRLLARAGVTVFSCVPTLASMMDAAVPSLRLLIFGGEECPRDLVRRWARPGLRIVNTYGPTEATVIATWGDCDPGEPVTLGQAVPGYTIHVLDDALRPLAPGVAGEICIGGVGLARGYVGRPDLTAERFVPSPFGEGRLYRTGDLGAWTAAGALEFRGRVDGQVKLRGFRIELAEIESVLRTCPGVRAAAVTVHEDTPGIQQLVGYLVPVDGEGCDGPALRARLRRQLPDYMIPALLEPVATLPVLPSGKVDRQKLPPPRARAGPAPRNDPVGPRTPRERRLLAVWERLFAPAAVSVQDHFFLDLGGHSLLAARMVSELRQDPQWQALSMLDVYRHPTVTALAAHLDQAQPTVAPTVFQPVPRGRYWRCAAAQAVSLFFVVGFFALQWLAPFLVYTVMIEEEYETTEAILASLAALTVFYPIMVLLSIAAKWLIVGRYRPGTYPLWGTYYFRWWLATTIESAVPVGYLAGSPLMGLYCRLMGAKIGHNVHLDADGFAIYDLLEIGDDSSVGVDANLLGYTIEDGCLKIGRVAVGRRCFVGARAVLAEDTTMEDDSALEDLSLLPRGARIPPGETWLGSPAKPVAGAAPTEASSAAAARPNRARRWSFGLLHALALLVVPALVTSAIFPGLMVMNELNYRDDYYWYLLLAPLVALSFVVLLCLEIVVLKWLLLGRVRAGRYPTHSLFYLRKWAVDQLMDLSLDVLGPLYASIYLAPWYRALGAKLARGAEVSTASFISPDLLSIGEDSFIADAVSLGAPRVRDGFMTIGPNRVGKRSFIGNSAILPPGTVIGDNCLIGCLSVPPANPADALREDTAWLGSPALFLPQRQRSTAFSEAQTFKPPLRLRAARAAIELVRILLPTTGFIVLSCLLFSALLLIRDELSLANTLLLVPVLYVGCGLVAVAFTVAMKWLLVGRYRPGEQPLWSTFVWRNEIINALHEHLADAFLVGLLTGTPFAAWYLRLMGAKIGRRVYLETTDFSEFDLVRIGNDVALNNACTLQTHLFEDRVMKMSTIEIAARARVGAGTLVLYDTRMEAGSSLGDLSLLMKGETLPAGTRWEGIPARVAATV